jgi:hypothetical protein
MGRYLFLLSAIFPFGCVTGFVALVSATLEIYVRDRKRWYLNRILILLLCFVVAGGSSAYDIRSHEQFLTLEAANLVNLENGTRFGEVSAFAVAMQPAC